MLTARPLLLGGRGEPQTICLYFLHTFSSFFPITHTQKTWDLHKTKRRQKQGGEEDRVAVRSSGGFSAGTEECHLELWGRKRHPR